MLALIAIGLLLALLYGPQLWVRAVMAAHSREREDFPGTGGQFAAHLIDRLELDGVSVEANEAGDHYDPDRRVVALSQANYQGRSLTAVAVAAHEVGHALQHQTGYRPLRLRHRLVRAVTAIQRVGSILVMASPLLLLASRSPTGLVVPLAGGLVSVAAGAVVHLVTLPVELDASFRRALPVLNRDYLPPADRPRARRILTAAALTYVAASLASILNVWYWLRLLRR
ncbi:zinc metallopeptidase [Thiohalorhabdus sp.]|uniref:zinc metallopeptidase n=1 Tax=Thiohalorhabdus sp. TaxID=3094134 RepID=UPI002FC29B78